MNMKWLTVILAISFFLLATLKAQEVSSMAIFFRAERTIKIAKFSEAKKALSASDQDLLELWESMLTGRTAPVARWMKDRYRQLGLNHLFTPSGFHLTAILSPLMKLFRLPYAQIFILSTIGVLLFFLPGQGALKRMVFIKMNQKFLGIQIGFVVALILDCLLGTFQESALSFSYSFLFLGIIYSGLEGGALILWFFLAQVLLAYFQGNDISPLLILLSPLLNLAFGLAMPFLFILSIPLWNWQLHSGLSLLRGLQCLVDMAVSMLVYIPSWEIHIGFLLMILLFIINRKKYAFIVLLFLCNSVNLDRGKNPSYGTQEFKPQGKITKIIIGEEEDLIYFEDGKCRRRLVTGYWWEKCSSKKRSTRHRKTKKSLLLS